MKKTIRLFVTMSSTKLTLRFLVTLSSIVTTVPGQTQFDKHPGFPLRDFACSQNSLMRLNLQNENGNQSQRN